MALSSLRYRTRSFRRRWSRSGPANERMGELGVQWMGEPGKPGEELRADVL
jgi:hypothetical protein